MSHEYVVSKWMTIQFPSQILMKEWRNTMTVVAGLNAAHMDTKWRSSRGQDVSCAAALLVWWAALLLYITVTCCLPRVSEGEKLNRSVRCAERQQNPTSCQGIYATLEGKNSTPTIYKHDCKAQPQHLTREELAKARKAERRIQRHPSDHHCQRENSNHLRHVQGRIWRRIQTPERVIGVQTKSQTTSELSRHFKGFSITFTARYSCEFRLVCL